MAIEPYTLRDNLVLEGGVIASGGCVVAGPVLHSQRNTRLAAFEQCVAEAAAILNCAAV
jgi:hypothetical protein